MLYLTNACQAGILGKKGRLSLQSVSTFLQLVVTGYAEKAKGFEQIRLHTI